MEERKNYTKKLENSFRIQIHSTGTKRFEKISQILLSLI